MDYILTMLVTWMVVILRNLNLTSRITSEHPALAFFLITYLVANLIAPISYLVFRLIKSFIDKR